MQEDFTSFYKRELLPALKDLEVLRKHNFKLFLYISLSCLGFALLFASIHIYMYSLPDWFPIAALFILAIVGGITYFVSKKPLRDTYKTKVIAKLVQYVNKDLQFFSHKSITRAEYMRSQLFRRRPDRYNGEDFSEGKIGKTDIKFSEVHSQYKQETRNHKGKKTTTWHTIFKGIFVIADFHKNFTTDTLVVPDTAEALFGGFGRRLQKMGASLGTSFGELVELENIEFEKEFAVYSHSQVEARYILSPGMMERILQYKKKWNRDIYISFVNSKINIAIPESENLFEPSFFTRLDNQQYYTRMVSYLELIVDIIEDLNLNTRIWTKD